MGGADDDRGYAITSNSTNVFVTGTFYSPTISMGSITLLASSGVVFVAKYDNSGNVVWASNVSGATNDVCFAIAVDASGLYLGGSLYSPSITFGSTTLINTTTGTSTLFVLKYDLAGSPQWGKTAYGNSSGVVYSVAPSNNSLYVTGSFYSSSVVFDGDTIYSFLGPDAYLAKLSIIVGIDEIKTESISISPNPATTSLTIQTEGSLIKELHIYNVLGECVYHLAIKSQQSEIKIDVSELTKGIFFVEISSDKGLVRTKFIKQ